MFANYVFEEPSRFQRDGFKDDSLAFKVRAVTVHLAVLSFHATKSELNLLFCSSERQQDSSAFGPGASGSLHPKPASAMLAGEKICLNLTYSF